MMDGHYQNATILLGYVVVEIEKKRAVE